MTVATMRAEKKVRASGGEDALDYRSVHSFAVLGLLLGVVSAVTLITAGSSLESTLLMAPIPTAGLIVSWLGLRGIRSASELYTGKPLAQAGLALSALFLGGGVGYSGYIYVTELPEGYERLTFVEIQPSEADRVAGKITPDSVSALINQGEPVFLKGYIRPDSIKFKQNIKNFLLVRDNNQCCFGDLSSVKFFDQVEVDLGPGLAADFHRGLFRLGGTLTRRAGNAELGTPITYHLQADYLKQ